MVVREHERAGPKKNTFSVVGTALVKSYFFAEIWSFFGYLSGIVRTPEVLISVGFSDPKLHLVTFC